MRRIFFSESWSLFPKSNQIVEPSTETSFCRRNNRDTALESLDIAFWDCATVKYVHTSGTLYAHIGTQQAQKISKFTIFIIYVWCAWCVQMIQGFLQLLQLLRVDKILKN